MVASCAQCVFIMAKTNDPLAIHLFANTFHTSFDWRPSTFDDAEVKKKKTLGSKKRKQNQATQCHGGNLAGVGMFGWKLFQDVYD